MYGNKGKRNLDHQIIYAFAHVESWIESYARGIGQPSTELCARVGTLLLTQGEGAGDTMSTMRGDSTTARLLMGEMEMAEHSHSGVHGRKQTKVKGKGKGYEWTPAMRRAASIRMRKHQAKLQAARRAKAEAKVDEQGLAELSA